MIEMLETEQGVFTPVYDWSSYDPMVGIQGLEVIESAQEYYDRWLTNKDRTPTPQPNKMEVLLNELSEALLESEMRAVETDVVINETSNYVLDLDERLTNIELKK